MVHFGTCEKQIEAVTLGKGNRTHCRFTANVSDHDRLLCEIHQHRFTNPSLTTKCGEGGTYGPRYVFFALSFLVDVVSSLSAICFLFKAIIENLQFAVQIEIFPKTLFCPTNTYSGLCSLDHRCTKILFLVGFGYDKKIKVRWSPPKIM